MKVRAKDGTTVVLTHHAKERMAERGTKVVVPTMWVRGRMDNGVK
jgi:hypothetical protein